MEKRYILISIKQKKYEIETFKTKNPAIPDKLLATFKVLYFSFELAQNSNIFKLKRSKIMKKKLVQRFILISKFLLFIFLYDNVCKTKFYYASLTCLDPPEVDNRDDIVE